MDRRISADTRSPFQGPSTSKAAPAKGQGCKDQGQIGKGSQQGDLLERRCCAGGVVVQASRI